MSDIRFQTFDESGNLIEDVLLPNPADNFVEANATPLLVSGPIAFKYENGDPVQFLTATKDLGKGQPIMQVAQATSTQGGFISAADWSTFNAKAPNVIAKADDVTKGLAGFSSEYFTDNGAGVISPKLADAQHSFLIDNPNTDGTIGVATFHNHDFLDNGNGAIYINYGGGQKADSFNPGFLSSSDWLLFNSKADFDLAKADNTTSITAGIANGTFGIASFSQSDFKDNGIGVIYLNYDDGQKATADHAGFLSYQDWSTFNSKQASITLTTVGTSGAATFNGTTLNIPNYNLGGNNLYNSDGTISSNRNIDLNGKYVRFNGSSGGNVIITSDGKIAAGNPSYNQGYGTISTDFLAADALQTYTLTTNDFQAAFAVITDYAGLSAILTPGKLDLSPATSSIVMGNDPQAMGSLYVNSLNNHLYYKSPSGTNYDLVSISSGGVTNITTTGPITGGPITTTGTIGIQKATAVQDGYLSSSDWSTFNSKLSSITLTTTGYSGVATLSGSTLNIPNYSAVDGANSSRWDYFPSISAPSSGQLRTNTGTLSSVTTINICTLNKAGINYSSWLAQIKTYVDGNQATFLKLSKAGDSSVEALYAITNISLVTSSINYYQLTLSFISGSGSLLSSDVLSVSWTVNGAAGAAGSTGIPGSAGSPGANGVVSILRDVSLVSPTTNEFTVDNSHFNDISTIYIDNSGLYSGWLLDLSDNLALGKICRFSITREGASNKFGLYSVDSYSLGSTYLILNLTFISGSGESFETNKNYSLSYSFYGLDGINGTNGTNGTSGANCVEFEFQSSTLGTPMSGAIKSNSAAVPSVSSFYISKSNALAIDVTTWLDILSNNLNAGKSGYLQISEKGDSSITGLYTIFSAFDAGSYYELTFTNVYGNGTLTIGNKYLISYVFDGLDPSTAGYITKNNSIALSIALG